MNAEKHLWKLRIIQNTNVVNHVALNVFKTLRKSWFYGKDMEKEIKEKTKPRPVLSLLVLLWVSRVPWRLTSISFNSLICRFECRASGPKCRFPAQIFKPHGRKQIESGWEWLWFANETRKPVLPPVAHHRIQLPDFRGRKAAKADNTLVFSCFTGVPCIYAFLQNQQCERQYNFNSVVI